MIYGIIILCVKQKRKGKIDILIFMSQHSDNLKIDQKSQNYMFCHIFDKPI